MSRIIITTPHDAARYEVEQLGSDLWPIYHFNGLYYGAAGYDDQVRFYADQARLAGIANEHCARVIAFGATESVIRHGAIQAAMFLIDNTSVEAVILPTADVPARHRTDLRILKITRDAIEIVRVRNEMHVDEFWMELACEARRALLLLPVVKQAA